MIFQFGRVAKSESLVLEFGLGAAVRPDDLVVVRARLGEFSVLRSVCHVLSDSSVLRANVELSKCLRNDDRNMQFGQNITVDCSHSIPVDESSVSVHFQISVELRQMREKSLFEGFVVWTVEFRLDPGRKFRKDFKTSKMAFWIDWHKSRIFR